MILEPSSRCLHLLPFGIPTLVIAEDPQLLAAAHAAYAHWSAEAPFAEPDLELRLESGSASSFGVCLDITVEGSRLSLTGRGAFGSADAEVGTAAAIIPVQMAVDAIAFADVFDTLMLFLLARRGRTPVHAAAFVIDGCAMVLGGPSGSGKSTLALAAAKRGYPVLTDDMVFVQREPSFAVWGFPRAIHVFPENAPPGDHPVRVRNEKVKSAVTLASSALKAQRAALFVLERGDELELSPIKPAKAVDSLMRLDLGFDLLARESREAIQALASLGSWRLKLTDDPGAAIELVVDCWRNGRMPAHSRA